MTVLTQEEVDRLKIEVEQRYAMQKRGMTEVQYRSERNRPMNRAEP